MNKAEQEILRYELKSEEKVLKELKSIYKESIESVKREMKDFQSKINEVNTLLQIVTDPKVREVLESQKQSAVYQKSYQSMIRKQLEECYKGFTEKTYNTINDYLNESYLTGFTGTMYGLYNQKIPMAIPIDRNMIKRAVENDSKISEGLYKRLGYNVEQLKNDITHEVTRGIATGSSWMNVAHSLEQRSNVDLNKSIRIARTESHKVAEQGGSDAAKKAVENGADIVKQWSSVLDNRTRSDHQILDGQIREMNEMFTVNGYQTEKPGAFGIASEDINCRCTVLYRARWAIDDDDAERLKKRSEYFKSIAQTGEQRNLLEQLKSKDFEEFRSKYLANSNNVSYNNTTKAIRIDDINSAIVATNLNPELSERIMDVLKSNNASYYFNSVEAVSLDPKIVLQTNAKQVGTWFDTVLQINTNAIGGKTIEEINEMFSMATNTICNSFDDAIIHELYHAKLIYGLNYAQVESLYNELSEIRIDGVSLIAKKDGAECIAEVGVLIERGEKNTVPNEALELFERFFQTND